MIQSPEALGHDGTGGYGTCIKCGQHLDGIYYSQEKCEGNMSHHLIERNGVPVKYGDTVLVEIDKISPLMLDRQAYKLDLATLTLVECKHSIESLPFFVEMTYSAELLSYHNWRNRIINYEWIDHAGVGVNHVYRLHRVSYNEFTWIELKPIDVAEFKIQYAGLRNPYEWEQIFGVRVVDERLKSMGLPREPMRAMTITQFFDAVEI